MTHKKGKKEERRDSWQTCSVSCTSIFVFHLFLLLFLRFVILWATRDIIIRCFVLRIYAVHAREKKLGRKSRKRKCRRKERRRRGRGTSATSFSWPQENAHHTTLLRILLLFFLLPPFFSFFRKQPSNLITAHYTFRLLLFSFSFFFLFFFPPFVTFLLFFIFHQGEIRRRWSSLYYESASTRQDRLQLHNGPVPISQSQQTKPKTRWQLQPLIPPPNVPDSAGYRYRKRRILMNRDVPSF